MDSEKDLLIKIKKNKKLNSWWLKLFNKQLNSYLNKLKVPSQTVGIFLNPYTSNSERIRIIKMFRKKD